MVKMLVLRPAKAWFDFEAGIARRAGVERAANPGRLLLIPGTRPPEERLGGGFFRQAPKRKGVYS
jgi:hypothetical protein